MANEILQIPLGLLDPSPHNARQNYPNLDELAATILEIGLLQNLVVKKDGDRFIVEAGNRRLRAMLRLVEQKHWTLDNPVPCRVVKDGEIESLVENIQREEVVPWEQGAGFIRLIDGRGLTHDQIARCIGKSKSYVSLRQRISRGLSPKLIPILIRIGAARPNVLELDKMAQLIDKDTLGPDHEKQRRWLERFLATGRQRKKGKRRTNQFFKQRIRALENMTFTPDVEPIIQAVIKFFDGEELVIPEPTEDPYSPAALERKRRAADAHEHGPAFEYPE
jgi:ParB/RepB/Spo0J family partition protein